MLFTSLPSAEAHPAAKNATSSHNVDKESHELDECVWTHKENAGTGNVDAYQELFESPFQLPGSPSTTSDDAHESMRAGTDIFGLGDFDDVFVHEKDLVGSTN